MSEDKKIRVYGCFQSAPPKEEDFYDPGPPDICWSQKYKNDSRNWILGIHKRKPSDFVSQTKEAYGIKDELPTIPRLPARARYLYNKWYEEVVKEVIEERNKPEEKTEYCTEYDGNYNAPGFEFKERDLEKDEEMALKYPLYKTQFTSYQKYLIDKGGNPLPMRVSEITDKTVPFRRSDRFTRPFDIDAVDNS